MLTWLVADCCQFEKSFLAVEVLLGILLVIVVTDRLIVRVVLVIGLSLVLPMVAARLMGWPRCLSERRPTARQAASQI